MQDGSMEQQKTNKGINRPGVVHLKPLQEPFSDLLSPNQAFEITLLSFEATNTSH